MHILLQSGRRMQVCVFTAPLFSAFCALTTYFLTKEVRNQGAGLFAALFAASVPSYISRSVAGSYDNEGVAIFALVLVFFLYVKVSQPFSRLRQQQHACRSPMPCQKEKQEVLWHSLRFVCLLQRKHETFQIRNISLTNCPVMQTINTGSLAWATANALGYYYMVRPPDVSQCR